MGYGEYKPQRMQCRVFSTGHAEPTPGPHCFPALSPVSTPCALRALHSLPIHSRYVNIQP